jgi:hypothetical protein
MSSAPVTDALSGPPKRMLSVDHRDQGLAGAQGVGDGRAGSLNRDGAAPGLPQRMEIDAR